MKVEGGALHAGALNARHCDPPMTGLEAPSGTDHNSGCRGVRGAGHRGRVRRGQVRQQAINKCWENQRTEAQQSEWSRRSELTTLRQRHSGEGGLAQGTGLVRGQRAGLCPECRVGSCRVGGLSWTSCEQPGRSCRKKASRSARQWSLCVCDRLGGPA